MTDVAIRAIETSDWQGLYALQQCPKVRRGTLKMPYQSPTATRQRLESLPETMYQLVAIASESDRLVGTLTLGQQKRSRQHAAFLGMAVHDDFQGQGIGSQLMVEAINLADNWLNLKRIELSVFIDNAPAVHLYQKFGFETEGTLKKYAFRAGNYIDAYTMARIV